MFTKTIFGSLVGLALATNVQASIINGDFESATALDGWSFLGTASEITDAGNKLGFITTVGGSTNVSAIDSTLGIDLAAETVAIAGAGRTIGNASIIYQSFNVTGVGDLSFDWNFTTNEAGGFKKPDYSFYVLQSVTELAQATDTTTPGYAGYTTATGFSTVNVTGLTAGSYLLGFGVVNVDNTLNQSALFIDNVVLADEPVPVPATAALLALGMMGLRRRRS